MKSPILASLSLAMTAAFSDSSGNTLVMVTHSGQALDSRQLPTMLAKAAGASRQLTEEDRVCEQCFLNDDMVEDLPAIGVQIIKSGCSATVGQISRYMAKARDALGVVTFVESDQKGFLQQWPGESSLLRRAQDGCGPNPRLGTNDPESGCQINLETIRMGSAYKEIERIQQTRSLKEVVVAVIDSGIDQHHPELVDRLWRNPIDGSLGYNFIDNNTDVTDKNQYGHGTHVAGIVAAETNNSIGIASVAAVVRPKIMALKFINEIFLLSDAARALNFAVEMGAQVSVNSYFYQNRSEIHRQAIVNAAARGHVFVTSSGNHGRSLDTWSAYPCSYTAEIPSILCTGATTSSADSNVAIARFSNTGAVVNIAAPGVRIESTIPGGYTKYNGTSMATPHVAGVAAILASLGLQGQAITDAIVQSAGRICGSTTPLLNAEGAVLAAEAYLLNA